MAVEVPYGIADGQKLEQGDFIVQCPVIIPEYTLNVDEGLAVGKTPQYHNDFLAEFASMQGKRLRLLSPYKEKMSAAFGYYFARVGLPQDIPSFT